MADVVILAEYAAQITAGEEDRTRAPPANEYALFPKVGSDGTDERPIRGTTKSRFAISAVRATLARTQRAGVDQLPKALGRLPEFALVAMSRCHAWNPN